MELRQLEYLRAIFEEGSFTAAARRCHVSQPALSQQVASLERELGVQLFARSSRGVRPTEAGRRFWDLSGPALERLDAGRLLFTGLPQRPLEVAAIPTLAPFLLPAVIVATRRVLPGLEIELLEARTRELPDLVRSGEVAFALASDIDEPGSGVEVVELGRERLLLAVPEGHELGSAPAVAVDDIDPATLLSLRSGHCLRGQSLQACRARDFREDAGVRCEQLSTLLALVSARVGIGVVPEMARASVPPGVELLRFADPEPTRSITLLRRYPADLDEAGEAFLTELHQGLV